MKKERTKVEENIEKAFEVTYNTLESCYNLYEDLKQKIDTNHYIIECESIVYWGVKNIKMPYEFIMGLRSKNNKLDKNNAYVIGINCDWGENRTPCIDVAKAICKKKIKLNKSKCQYITNVYWKDIRETFKIETKRNKDYYVAEVNRDNMTNEFKNILSENLIKIYYTSISLLEIKNPEQIQKIFNKLDFLSKHK